MTNYEKIRNMSVDEMADLIIRYIDWEACPATETMEERENRKCNYCMKQYLESEAKDE